MKVLCESLEYSKKNRKWNDVASNFKLIWNLIKRGIHITNSRKQQTQFDPILSFLPRLWQTKTGGNFAPRYSLLFALFRAGRFSSLVSAYPECNRITSDVRTLFNYRWTAPEVESNLQARFDYPYRKLLSARPLRTNYSFDDDVETLPLSRSRSRTIEGYSCESVFFIVQSHFLKRKIEFCPSFKTGYFSFHQSIYDIWNIKEIYILHFQNFFEKCGG